MSFGVHIQAGCARVVPEKTFVRINRETGATAPIRDMNVDSIVSSGMDLS